MPNPGVPNKFLVAFSLAGEQRDLVRKIAESVERDLGQHTVFFDEWFEYLIAGDDADLRLQKIYGTQCELVVVCVSGQYGDKPWTRAEHRAIRARSMAAQKEQDKLRILPIRVGDGEVEGILFNTVAPEVRERSVTYATKLILDRLRLIRPDLEVNEMRYHDFTLLISAGRIDITSKIGDDSKDDAAAEFSVDPLTLLCVQRLHFWLNYFLERFPGNTGQDQPCKLDLKAIGLLLHRILFSNEKISDAFDKAYKEFNDPFSQEKGRLTMRGRKEIPKRRFRLQLILDDSADKDLTTLPWEFLFVPAQGDAGEGLFFSGKKTELILTRYSPDEDLEERLKPQPGKLRILVVGTWSEPVGSNTGHGEEELLQQIRNLQDLNHIDTELLPDPRDKKQVETSIESFKPHIVHYIGYGGPDGLALSANAKISREDFKGLFSEHPPRLVFLQSRNGATYQSLQSLNSTARDLVDAKIPAVIAMQYSISDNDAGKFAWEFYTQLGLGRNIDEAVQSGRAALGNRPPEWAHPRFGTPVLYLLCRNAIVMPPDDSAKPRPVPAGSASTAATSSGPLAGASSRDAPEGCAAESDDSAQIQLRNQQKLPADLSAKKQAASDAMPGSTERPGEIPMPSIKPEQMK
jgi:CHAT domain/TIR domain